MNLIESHSLIYSLINPQGLRYFIFKIITSIFILFFQIKYYFYLFNTRYLLFLTSVISSTFFLLDLRFMVLQFIAGHLKIRSSLTYHLYSVQVHFIIILFGYFLFQTRLHLFSIWNHQKFEHLSKILSFISLIYLTAILYNQYTLFISYHITPDLKYHIS